MFRDCKYCKDKFLVLPNNHISQKIKKFCSRKCKDLWSQKYSPMRRLSHTLSNKRYHMKISTKIKRHLYFKSYYIPHPRVLLTKEEKLQRRRIWDRNYKYRLRKLNNPLSLELIQRIYEDNIKKFGRLTCYLCLKSIDFGKDSLEHKIPLARGGTNEYMNLAVAHKECNNKKNVKTYQEYMALTDTP